MITQGRRLRLACALPPAPDCLVSGGISPETCGILTKLPHLACTLLVARGTARAFTLTYLSFQGLLSFSLSLNP